MDAKKLTMKSSVVLLMKNSVLLPANKITYSHKNWNIFLQTGLILLLIFLFKQNELPYDVTSTKSLIVLLKKIFFKQNEPIYLCAKKTERRNVKSIVSRAHERWVDFLKRQKNHFCFFIFYSAGIFSFFWQNSGFIFAAIDRLTKGSKIPLS